MNRTPLAERVIALRKERGLTQVELAVEVGWSRSHISKIESGGDPPGRELLTALAKHFRVSMDYLQTGAEAAPAPSHGRFVDDREQLAILDLIDAIPRPERPRVLRMIRAAADDPARTG